MYYIGTGNNILYFSRYLLWLAAATLRSRSGQIPGAGGDQLMGRPPNSSPVAAQWCVLYTSCAIVFRGDDDDDSARAVGHQTRTEGKRRAAVII